MVKYLCCVTAPSCQTVDQHFDAFKTYVSFLLKLIELSIMITKNHPKFGFFRYINACYISSIQYLLCDCANWYCVKEVGKWYFLNPINSPRKSDYLQQQIGMQCSIFNRFVHISSLQVNASMGWKPDLHFLAMLSTILRHVVKWYNHKQLYQLVLWTGALNKNIKICCRPSIHVMCNSILIYDNYNSMIHIWFSLWCRHY